MLLQRLHLVVANIESKGLDLPSNIPSPAVPGHRWDSWQLSSLPQRHSILLRVLQAPGVSIVANITLHYSLQTITSRGKDFEQSGQEVHGEADRGGETPSSGLALALAMPGWRASFSSDPFSAVALGSGGADSWL